RCSRPLPPGGLQLRGHLRRPRDAHQYRPHAPAPWPQAHERTPPRPTRPAASRSSGALSSTSGGTMNSPNSNNLTPPQAPSSANMESRIDRAIEHKPEVQIPADFAVKVAALAAAQPLRRRRYKPQFGPMIALVSAPVAALALFLLA